MTLASLTLNTDGIIAIVVAVAALLGVVFTKKTHAITNVEEKARRHEVNEVVDDSVLGQFKELFERIGVLEVSLAEAKADLARALSEINELRNLEEYLQARLHEKDAEVAVLRTGKAASDANLIRLRAELMVARKRIKYLEDACHRAGINGDGTNLGGD